MHPRFIVCSTVLFALVTCLACGDDATSNGGTGGSSGTSGTGGTGGVGATGGTGGVGATGGTGGVAVDGLGAVLSQQTFSNMFLHQHEPACNAQLYTYAALITAAQAFPLFGTVGSDEIRRREVAAFLANISHETTGGWSTAPDGATAWGLCFREEVGCVEGGCTQYCDASNVMYPCANGVTYHGRGPMQLSWNYNYGYVGAQIGEDLLSNPSLITSDAVIGWTTALWFWMTPRMPKPSAHDVMTGAWNPTPADIGAGRLAGFGLTVNIINGGLECGIANDHRVEDRVAFFERYVTLLDTSVGDNLRCETQQHF